MISKNNLEQSLNEKYFICRLFLGVIFKIFRFKDAPFHASYWAKIKVELHMKHVAFNEIINFLRLSVASSIFWLSGRTLLALR